METPPTTDVPAASVALSRSIAKKMRLWASDNQMAAARSRTAAAEARVARHNANVAERQRKRVQWHVGKLIGHLCKLTGANEAQMMGLLHEELTRLKETRMGSSVGS